MKGGEIRKHPGSRRWLKTWFSSTAGPVLVLINDQGPVPPFDLAGPFEHGRGHANRFLFAHVSPVGIEIGGNVIVKVVVDRIQAPLVVDVDNDVAGIDGQRFEDLRESDRGRTGPAMLSRSVRSWRDGCQLKRSALSARAARAMSGGESPAFETGWKSRENHVRNAPDSGSTLERTPGPRFSLVI